MRRKFPAAKDRRSDRRESSRSERRKASAERGSKKRKRSESEGSSSTETNLKTQVQRLMEKLKDMEASRKWNSASNEKQYLHQVKVRQLCVEDFRDALEEHFGDKRKIPAKLVAVVKKGEKEINDRIKILKMADRVSWTAVDKFRADPLCDGDEDYSRYDRN